MWPGLTPELVCKLASMESWPAGLQGPSVCKSASEGLLSASAPTRAPGRVPSWVCCWLADEALHLMLVSALDERLALDLPTLERGEALLAASGED